MSDGGGRESGKGIEPESKKKSRGGNEFGLAISRIAVAQICEEVGFQSFQQSALGVLSDIAIRYLRELGKLSRSYAELAGRTECNVFDIIQVLEDLGSTQGFSGSSEINHCLASSGVVREIIQYVNLTDEIPFARPVPGFPVVRNCKPTPSFLQIGEDPAVEHIPAWLPAFPDPQTYAQTSTCNERETDHVEGRSEQEKEHRKAEWSLLNMQQRLACNGSAATTSADPGDAAKAKRTVDSDPFLAPPLQSSEIEIHPPDFPSKLSNEAVTENRVSVLEAFSPAIQAIKSGLCDTGNVQEKILPSKRPTVHFKLGVGKKSLDIPPELRLRNQDVGKADSWLRDDEKDDKKRRAEQILKDSMENSRELA